MSSSSTSIFNREIPSECDCLKPLKLRTSWTLSNPARRFLVCPNSLSKGRKCKAFFWFDPELHNQRYRETMYELYMMLNQEDRQEITTQDQREEMLHLLETEFDLYKSKMTNEMMCLQLELNKSQSNVRFYKKVALVSLLLATFMFILY